MPADSSGITSVDGNVSNRSATVTADNEDEEEDHGTTILAAHVELSRKRRMFSCTFHPSFQSDHSRNSTEHKRARTVHALAIELVIPNLVILLRWFLFERLNPDDPRDIMAVPPSELPCYNGAVSVFNSASSRFYAPSDLSGTGGMHTEYIRSCPVWRGEGPRHDCVFVGTDPNADGMHGYEIARVFCFFSFVYKGITYPCAVVRWFDKVGEEPDDLTGMWIVRPATLPNNTPNYAIIHIDSIYRAAHLIPIYCTHPIPLEIKPHHSYDAFNAFYVNKYADHHSFAIAS